MLLFLVAMACFTEEQSNAPVVVETVVETPEQNAVPDKHYCYGKVELRGSSCF